MNFFLVDVWKQSKRVFAFFVLFILATIWCSFSKTEITPFFLWAHYSDQETLTGSYDRIYIKVNGEILDLPKLSRPTREMIQLPTEYFVQLEERSYRTSTRHVLRKHLKDKCSKSFYSKMEKRLVNSQEDCERYMKWLARYIEQVYGVKVNELYIGTCDLVFQEDRTVKRVNKKPIAKLSENEVLLR
ncbi:MAG: hypothetical protein AB8B56_16110 [Crocinitomicaceae bacterium]